MNQDYKIKLRGIPASPGIAIGKIHLLSGGVIKIQEKLLKDHEIEPEIQKFQQAVDKAKAELQKLQQRATQKLGVDDKDAEIFDVHLMLLNDPAVINQTIELIREEKKNADLIFYRHMSHFQNMFENSVSGEYFKEKSADILDVKRRVIRLIQGLRCDYLSALEESSVIVARELTPSETIMLDRNKILAFATDMGSRTSHAAIMARSLAIPSVVGLEHLSEAVNQYDTIIVDGNKGEIIIEPSPDILEEYQKLQADYYAYERNLVKFKDLPCRTLDGKDIELSANLEFPDEIESVISHGANGIGLYRTEYLFLAKSELPSEEEQFEAYRSVAEKIAPNSVIIRTADLGGDKSPISLSIPKEDNPYLGWRAIRICLKETDMFKAQLRAILRASSYGNIKIMFPMISCIEELTQCLALLDEAKQELIDNNLSFNDNIEIGTMIEVPSAALMTDVIARKVDFLSIGTNDLIQYTLAADRGNERISYLYENFPPAVIRLIKQIVDSGHRKGVWVGMCGEMASDPKAVLVLIGLGLDELSLSPVALPEIKKIIRSIKYSEATHIAQKVMQMETAIEIRNYLDELTENKLKDLAFV